MPYPPPVEPLLQHRRNLTMALAKLATENAIGAWALVQVIEGERVSVLEFASPYMLSNHPSNGGSVTGSHRFVVTVALVPQELVPDV